MAKDKDTVQADLKAIHSVIDDVQIVRTKQDGISPPCALYKGTAPDVGATIKFRLDNGVVYSGVVAEVTDAAGEVLVEFKDGIQPQK